MKLYSLISILLLLFTQFSFAQSTEVSGQSQLQGLIPDMADDSIDKSYYCRIRISPLDAQVSNPQVTIDPDLLNATVNIMNKEPFVFLGLILNSAFNIDYKLNGIAQKMEWRDVALGPAKDKILRFRKELLNHGLKMEIDRDPSLLNCLSLNTMVRLTISYGYKQDGSVLQPEQKKINARCYIDNDGVITLPVFYESINSNVTPNIGDTDITFDAVSNSTKLKLLNQGECGGNNCVTPFEAEKRITAFYTNRIKENQFILDVHCAVSSYEELNAITVFYKRHKTIFPYAQQAVNDFLSTDFRRSEIGIKKKCMKVKLFTRCNIFSPSVSRTYRFRVNRNYKRPLKTLLPGDLIYIK